MKAIRINEFGGLEVLKLEEVERPVPAADEVLVKTYASGVNPADCVIRRGGNDVLRPFLKLPLILGWDASGVVEETGSDVTSLQKGDAVYGIPNFPGDGSYAEYFVAKANQMVLKPQSIGFIEAAAVPLAGVTAWNGIFDFGKLQPGQRILIHGAAGGVGSLAVQFAKAKSAYVIGTASANNIEFLHQLGADEVIDYKNQKFEELLHDVDVVFDASPVRDNTVRLKFVQVLKEGGVLVCSQLDFPFDDDVKKALVEKKATGELVGIGTYECLQEIASLIDEGNVQVVVSNVYPLEKAAEAHKESETGHVRGKLVLEIRKEA